MDGSPAITVREVAAYLSVDEKTVYRLAQRAELPVPHDEPEDDRERTGTLIVTRDDEASGIDAKAIADLIAKVLVA